MFKRSIITDEATQDFEHAVDLAVQLGLEGVEIRSVWDKGPHQLSSAEIAKIKALCQSHNLKVVGISAPFFKCSLDSEEEYNQNIEILKKSIAMAKELDCKIIRSFAFWMKEGGIDKNLDLVAKRFALPVKMVEEAGMVLAIENEPSCLCNNAKNTRKIIEAVNSKSLRSLWDPGNDIYDPENEVPFPDGYNMVKDLMVHMHIKDSKHGADGNVEPAKMGEGEVDMLGQFKALLKDGYSGWISLETHWRVKQLSEDERLLPSGSSFSAGGEEASIQCMEEWNKILDQAQKAI